MKIQEFQILNSGGPHPTCTSKHRNLSGGMTGCKRPVYSWWFSFKPYSKHMCKTNSIINSKVVVPKSVKQSLQQQSIEVVLLVDPRIILAGGFNPSEEYARQIGSFPQVGVKIKIV